MPSKDLVDRLPENPGCPLLGLLENHWDNQCHLEEGEI
jgi:hypothetical protein